MNKLEMLYTLYKENPKLTNREVTEKLGWDDELTKVKKYQLKKRGYIDTFDGEVIILKSPYKEPPETEAIDWKKDAYHELFEACINKLRTADCSPAQYISLVQESRLILKEI